MNESSRTKEEHKRINRRFLYTYITVLVSVQASGLLLLFHNLNFYSAIIVAVALGFVSPILLGLIFIILAKRLEKRLGKLR